MTQLKQSQQLARQQPRLSEPQEHQHGQLTTLVEAHPLLPWLAAWAAFVPVAVMRAGVIADSDIFWQIRTGLLIISHRSIPAADPFSWTVHGRLWTQNSWGFDLLAGAAYRVAGLAGAAWVCAALMLLAVAVALAIARYLGGTAFISGALLMGGLIVMIPFQQARPELTDFAAIPVLTLLLRLICAQDAGRGRRVMLTLTTGVVSATWVNLHAAALFGVAIAVAATVLVAARRRWLAARWCGAATAAMAAGALANPLGAGLVAQTEHVQSASAGVITEWQHFNPASPMQWIAILLGVAALAVAVRRRDEVLIAALGLALAGSFDALRIQPILVLLALPVLASAASSQAVRRYVRSRRVVLYPGVVAVVITLIVLAAPSLSHIGRPDPAIYPARVVAAIPAHCRLFNAYLLGGYVILERPDVPVSLDSRNDLYGTRLVVAEARVLDGHGNLTRELAGAGCVLTGPASGLARRLERDPDWIVRAKASAGVLFVHR